MADTIYTRALRQAGEAQGSTQALAGVLHVPENTLLRWMSGRAQMPLRAFLKLVELLVEHELHTPEAPREPGRQPMQFRLGAALARCPRCNGVEFTGPTGHVPMSALLACASCGDRVEHRQLVIQLARDAVHRR